MISAEDREFVASFATTIAGVYATRPGAPDHILDASPVVPTTGHVDRGGSEQRRPSPAPSPATQPHRTEQP